MTLIRIQSIPILHREGHRFESYNSHRYRSSDLQVKSRPEYGWLFWVFIMSYFFYIIYSVSLDNYYIGHASDLNDRIKKHNTNHKGYTGRANDWTLAYSEEYPDKKSAYARERQVKAWKSRIMIEKLINSSKAEKKHDPPGEAADK